MYAFDGYLHLLFVMWTVFWNINGESEIEIITCLWYFENIPREDHRKYTYQEPFGSVYPIQDNI